MADDTHPLAMDTPQYTPEELAAARAYINETRKHFRLLLSYAEDVTFTTTSNTRGDLGPIVAPASVGEPGEGAGDA